MTVTILDADKRIGTHVFATVARNDAGPALDRGHHGHSPIPCYGTSVSTWASYKDGFDPLADEYRNYSYGTRIWQISCSILRDTIWVVIPRYQAPFIMS